MGQSADIQTTAPKAKPGFHWLNILEVRRETPDCVSIAFEVPPAIKDKFQYQSGQYLTLRADINGEDVRRSYSICSAPQEELLRVAVKKVPGGRFSTFANEQLKAGDRLEVMPPMGNFTLKLSPENQSHYVAFAAGSGITPILSLIKDVLHTEPNSQFTLFYGNRTVDSIIFRDELEDLKNTFLGRLSVHHVLSRENMGSRLFGGRIDAEKSSAFCDLITPPVSVDQWMLCGPESMIFTVQDTLLEKGVPKEHIHYELFTTPGQGKVAPKTTPPAREFDPEKESQVTIIVDGLNIDLRLPYGGPTILDAALKAGADLPFACKGGVCCTCRAKLVEGHADMDVNYALEPDEVEAGFILTCQAHPRSVRLTVDFDVR